MHTRHLFAIVLLAMLCSWGASSLAGAQTPPADALVDRLLATPPAALDDALAQNRAQLNVDLLKRVMERSVQSASAGKVPDAVAMAELADRIDYFMGGNKEYRGIGQSQLARLLVRQKNLDVPQGMARQILQRNPKSYYGHIILARVYLEKPDLDAALASTRAAAAARPDAEEAHVLMGTLYTRKGDSAAALAEFKRALEINPNNAYSRDAISLLSGSKPSSTGTKSKEAVAHMNQAEVFFGQKKYREAIVEYQKAVVADPKYGAAYVYMGDSYLSLEDVDRAVTCYKKAIEVEPGNRQAHRFLGDVYERIYDKTGDVKVLDQAISCFQKALEVDPTYHSAAQDLERARDKRKKLPQ